MLFQSKKPHYQYLHHKWNAKHKQLQSKLWENHGDSFDWLYKNVSPKHIAAGSLGGLLLMTTPFTPPVVHAQPTFLSRDDVLKGYDKNVLLAEELEPIIPADKSNLASDQEAKVAQILSRDFDLKVKAEIDNKRLNRTYGIIGGEQHLYRYPGDTLYNHAKTSEEWAKYGGAGIAPGLGAWGYFAPSQEQFTEKDEEREKYYLAVQTFLSPGFAGRVAEYRDFYKFRKMIVVNPDTGQAVIAVIGAAGPGSSTGKHLGGSPEVMDALGLATGPRKGGVLYFFVDDPEDKVPLGPIQVSDTVGERKESV